MIRRLTLALIGITAAAVVPALASGVSVASSTLDTYRTCVLSGVSAASTAVADAFVNQGSPNANSGTTTSMDVQARTGQNRRVHIRFDLTLCSPAVASTATVTDAQLDLFVTSIATACRTIDVFRVATTWAETTVTWNNQPFGTAVDNPPAAQRTAFTTIGAAPCTYTATNQYVSWSVTADVASWVSGAATNHGWMLRDDSEVSGTTRLNRFSASEANNAARAPRLVITYRP
ncbi:MAG: DNRLRE domain-containing protein [Acidimicrobiia bacterium]|nr:DNRLRE domain-containing protein [Acidimicrobiia bacterium]